MLQMECRAHNILLLSWWQKVSHSRFSSVERRDGEWGGVGDFDETSRERDTRPTFCCLAFCNSYILYKVRVVYMPFHTNINLLPSIVCSLFLL